MTSKTQNRPTYSHLEKDMAKLVRTVKLKCVANYLLYAAASLTVYLYADGLLSQVTNQITMH